MMKFSEKALKDEFNSKFPEDDEINDFNAGEYGALTGMTGFLIIGLFLITVATLSPVAFFLTALVSPIVLPFGLMWIVSLFYKGGRSYLESNVNNYIEHQKQKDKKNKEIDNGK